ncbi:MAG: hypothetical protein ACP59X_04360 [Solidesulfovibrio sp. DCME]|uniref:hypothetical protein n=1 Tax=Solidesulfovibrio sp. DCME TaxID=3447380 RepID=UPI003D0BD1A8
MTASTPRDAERMFREQGFSRKAAKIAVAGMRSQGAFVQKPKQNFVTRIFNALKGE